MAWDPRERPELAGLVPARPTQAECSPHGPPPAAPHSPSKAVCPEAKASPPPGRGSQGETAGVRSSYDLEVRQWDKPLPPWRPVSLTASQGPSAVVGAGNELGPGAGVCPRPSRPNDLPGRAQRLRARESLCAPGPGPRGGSCQGSVRAPITIAIATALRTGPGQSLVPRKTAVLLAFDLNRPNQLSRNLATILTRKKWTSTICVTADLRWKMLK